VNCGPALLLVTTHRHKINTCHHGNLFIFIIIIISSIIITYVDGSHGGIGFSAAFICLSFFSHTISQKTTRPGSPNLTQKCSTPNPGNPFILGSKVKVTRHTKLACGGLQTERYIAACCICLSHARFPCCNALQHKPC